MINPAVVWVDIDKVDLSASAKPMTLQLGVPGNLGGDVSTKFEPEKPFKFLAA